MPDDTIKLSLPHKAASPAHQLLQLTKMTQVIGQLANGLLGQAKNSIAANSAGADQEELQKVLALFEEEYRKEIGGLSDAVAGLYEEVLSADDIDGIVGFYQSELGQRFLAAGTNLEQKLQTTAQGWSQATSQAAFSRAMARAQ